MSRGLTIFLAIMAGLFILVANFSLWLGGSIFNQEAFTDTTVDVMRTQAVREAISAEIIAEALKDFPELRDPVSSSLKGIISGLLASQAARPALEKLAEGANKAFIADRPTAVRLNLRSIIKELDPFIATINREFNVNVSTDEFPKSIVVVKKGEIPTISGWGVPLLWLGPVLGVSGLALIIGAVWFAGAARAFVLRVNGFVLAASALIFWLLTRFAYAPLSASVQNENARAITIRLFAGLTRRLEAQTWILVGAGIVMVVAGIVLSRISGRPLEEEPKGYERAA